MIRLDQRMVEEGLAPSRARAQSLIRAGQVTVDGDLAAKPSLRTDGRIDLAGDPNPWVSRAGLKLDHALDLFDLIPSGTALDLGASTGGFTQVLLARGADRVFAVDVGHGQLHADIAADPRVVEMSGRNARALRPGDLPPPDWITADLSFISLVKALPAALDLAQARATLIALIKPQFEAGRDAIGKGGIVRDPDVHRTVCGQVSDFLQARQWNVRGVCDSPIPGGDGNREFLIWAQGPA